MVMLLLLVTVAASLPLGGCRSPAREPEIRATPATPALAATAASRAVTIKAGSRRAFSFTQSGDTVTVDGADGAPGLVGERRSSGERSYRVREGTGHDGGVLIAEVKSRAEGRSHSEAGFKVRGGGGALLWKVKISGEKIKIAAHEGGADHWLISLEHADNVTVTDKVERAIGSVRYLGGGSRVEVRDAGDRELYSAHTDLRSALFAVLLIDEIPERDKQILMAELLARGY